MALVLALFAALAGGAAESGWIDLTGDKELTAWTPPTDGWVIAGGIALDPQNPRRLAWKPGSGILVNGPKGSARNLVTRQKFTDLEAHVEFLIAKGSNSGVKFMGLYEIQIVDSNGRKELTGDSCGGIYPRAEEKPRYHHIDQGVPPKVNAAKPAGEWQTLDMVFQAPRFDAAGQKIANARFVKVVLNGQVVQENVEVPWPTGAAWRQRQEVPAGPFLLQGDHGPVAFRNVRIRPWSAEAGKGKP
jgi:hypothetical protein